MNIRRALADTIVVVLGLVIAGTLFAIVVPWLYLKKKPGARAPGKALGGSNR
jgi:hypothetical protein